MDDDPEDLRAATVDCGNGADRAGFPTFAGLFDETRLRRLSESVRWDRFSGSEVSRDRAGSGARKPARANGFLGAETA
jgi:hypothetical protein